MNKINESAKIFIMTILVTLLSSPSYGTTYECDVLNRLTRVVYDDGKVIEYTYDTVGNRTRKISTLLADSSVDNSVNFRDFAIVASRWLDEECGYADEWCDRADIDWSGEVDIEDLAIIAEQWLESIN